MTGRNYSDGFKFRMAVETMATREWLDRQGASEWWLQKQEGQPTPPSMPILRVIHEFIDEKIAKALYQERDPLKAFRSMADLRVVLRDLIGVGYSFQSMLAIVDEGLDRAAKMMRDHLVAKYLNPATPEEDAAEINAMLVEIISRGAWPNWQEEYEDAVWASEMGLHERVC
jgi:hypothetical protein